MFTGFNSDVERDGRTFHVQTEDRGLGNPVLETRVYSGGQVVATVRRSYADLADSPDYSHDEIQRRMREQHAELIDDLERGRLESEWGRRDRAPRVEADPAVLLDEFYEDWIEAGDAVAPVREAIDAEAERTDTARRRSAQKKKPSASSR